MDDCRKLVRGWMIAAGMKVEIDAAGNIRGSFEGDSTDTPRLVIASHLDTVPNAGKYDGILGVMLGIALVERLQGERLPFSVEVIGFSDEEGVRYGVPFIGSRAVVGHLDPSYLALLDSNGVSLGDALDHFKAANPQVVPPTLHPRTAAYLEFHIEQGPFLESQNLPLAVVESIAGQSRAKLTFHGRAGHAGTTPMAMRKDALTATAEWLLAVEATARATHGLVASTGLITCEPGAANSIAGRVSCSLDVRSENDSLRERALKQMHDAAVEIASKRGIDVDFILEADQATVLLDPSLTNLAKRAVSNAQLRATGMPSGAGHDAMIIAPHVPTSMIFLRSPGGISHHPQEAVLPQDVSCALRAGMHFLKGFMGWLESEDKNCNQ